MIHNDGRFSGPPKTLLGPILRRTDQSQVCIWIACSAPVTVRAEVFRYSDIFVSNDGKQTPPSPLGTGITKSIKLGQHLHIALVVAKPASDSQSGDLSGFPTDTLLAYDIEITADSPGARSMRLGDLGLTTGKNSIVYPDRGTGEHCADCPLPTFFVSGNKNLLNIVHGSCRKLHGKGEDCLAVVDKLIASSPLDLQRRPSVLFLTGDQIYADDVAEPLGRYLTHLGITLLGWEEKVSGVNKMLSELKPGERQKVIKEFARFTAEHAENHLLGFGEYAAMYMLAWSVENWPAGLESLKAPSRRCLGQIRQLAGAMRDLPAVRRVLANIPTYMIFDDHDITDDWNLTREWHDNVAASQCGKQVVTNGLAAYWAFQGWGNDPARFSEAFIRTVTEYFGKQGKLLEAAKQEFENFLWNFHGWTFTAPTDPLSIFADCRTQRDYDTFKGAPQLIGEQGLLAISRAAEDAGFEKGSPVILVVPTPVLGFYLIESLQKTLAKLTSVYTFDLETWFANTMGRVRFLTFILTTFAPRHCIFLSGDVHYGFTIKAAFAPLENGRGTDNILSITQLNSSAMKTTSLVKIALVSEILGRIRQLFPFKRLIRTGRLDRLRGVVDKRLPDWIEARSIVHANGSLVPPLIISDNNIGVVAIEDKLTTITHRLLVRKSNDRIRIHESVIRTLNGRNLLEDSVMRKASEYVLQKPFS